MKIDNLKQFSALKASLEQERAEIQARLSEIASALGAGEIPAPVAAVRRGPGRPKGSADQTVAPKGVGEEFLGVKRGRGRPKGTMSPAGRAAIVAAQEARWAKSNAAKAAKTAVVAPWVPAQPEKKAKPFSNTSGPWSFLAGPKTKETKAKVLQAKW